ncbi:MAG TPA: META domain-containing protein [Salegentibacter sp.]|nr:META domain-containing protein [Salegentibacter sp.]
MKKLVFVLSLALMLFSCENESVSENPSDLQKRSGSYDLIILDEEDISSEGFILELEGEEQRLSGKTGCNNFVATYEVEEKQLKFNPSLGTKMYCEGEMENEETFRKILPQIRKVKISEEELVFLSEENKELLKLQKINESE